MSLQTIDPFDDVHQMLIRARHTIAASVEDSGGCDHAVGVCCCQDIDQINQIDSYFLRNCTVERLMYATVRAAGYSSDTALRIKYIDRITAVIHGLANEMRAQQQDSPNA